MISAFSLCNLVGKKLNASLLEILPFPLIKAVKASYAVAIWPVTGQGFQNTKWPAVLSFQSISQIQKNPAKPNYHMSINKSQAILKCFIDKNSVWFMLGSEDETMVCDT